MNYDDETLMAYADGELDEARRAEIDRALHEDPALAQRVEQHRALRARVSGAFADVLGQPVPASLLEAARASRAQDEIPPRAEVIRFPERGAPPAAPRWRAQQWAAMAASVLVGMLVSWKLFAPAEPLMETSGGALVARGALARALEAQLAATQTEEDAVHIGITFATHDGRYCRSFALRDAATAGLACHVQGEWNIAVTAEAPGDAGGLRRASSPPPAVLQAIEARMSGEPLDAAAEERASGGGWAAAPL